MKHLVALAFLVLALSSPGWADPGGPEADGCYTDRKWRRHCPAKAAQIKAAIMPAKARAKERTLDTYQAMKEAKARAKTGAPREEAEPRRPGPE